MSEGRAADTHPTGDRGPPAKIDSTDLFENPMSTLGASVPTHRIDDDSAAITARGARPPEVSGYRTFMTVILVCICAVVNWADRTLAASGGSDLVGLVCVVVWALTIVGAFGAGPVRMVWDSLRP
jgi:hypothetical protein